MEIEAKFVVPTEETCQRLRTVDHLVSFALSAGQVKQMHDTYLDTPDRLILAAGYACRMREQDEDVLITLKGLRGAEGAVHRREELEVSLLVAQPAVPQQWPASPVRDKVLQLIGEAVLTPLFDLRQNRIFRQVCQNERLVAELSLDEVHLAAGSGEQILLEVEIELQPQGTEDDLAAIVTCLRDEWGLEPEPLSKFERGLTFVEEATLGDTQPEAEELSQPWPLETLFDQYGVDRMHARTVADHALALFDHLLPTHGLPLERRPLLEVAALVHNVGLETDPARHHIVGRDILLAHPPAGLDDAQRLIVALTTFLHRKRITPKKLDKLAEGPFADLLEPTRAEALALAALVRVADGLDYAQTGSSRLGQVRRREGAIEFEVLGPAAAVDAARAQAKSDLWRLLFGTELQFTAAEPAVTGATDLGPVPEEPAEPEPPSLPTGPGLEADDSMAEAARKTFLFHLQRMAYHEPGTRLGEDIEELHDMRVATRRMRAALDVFGDYLDLDHMSPFIKGLRRTGRALGRVRDLDVFWEKTQRYLDTLPPERQSELDPLRVVWDAERKGARKRMLTYLDSDRYQRFKEGFGEFLQAPGAGALPVLSQQGEPLPHRLRHVVPVAIYQRLAAVRAYDEWMTGPDVPLERLHQLRIAAKGLRYTVEYFQEVLEPEAKALINEVKALQNHLGDLQDAVVASNLLRDFLTWGTWGEAQGKKKRTARLGESIIAPGVAAYLTARQTELQHLVETFPQVWTRFQDPEFSQLVASIVADL